MADTKWKRLDTRVANASPSGIAQAALYQMYAYGHKYLRHQQHKTVVLIYPCTETFFAPMDPFTFENEFTLFILPYNLDPDPELDRLMPGEEIPLVDIEKQV